MNYLIYIVTFFIYSGYYVGLTLLFGFGLSGLSSFYSIPLRIALCGLMIYIIFRHLKNPLNKRLALAVFGFTVFWIFYILKVIFSETALNEEGLSLSWMNYIFYAITYVVLPYFTYALIPLEKYKNLILNAFIFSGFLLAVIGTIFYGPYLLSGIGRISMLTHETGQDAISPLVLSYSGILTISLCGVKILFHPPDKTWKWGYLLLAIIFSFVTFLLGSSRGSVVAFILTLPIFFYLTPLRRKLPYLLGILVFIPASIWLMKISGSNLLERISNTKEDAGGGRESLWAQAWNHFLDHPVFGGQIEIGGIYPHNIILEILMATGITGALLIFPVIYTGFKNGLKLAITGKQDIFFFIIILQGFIQYLFTGGLYFSTLVFAPMAMAINLYTSNPSATAFKYSL